MWIKRLQVKDWAGIADAAIDLEPGLNVLHGPNELGKSSLVSAIRAALLLQSTSAAAEPLRDWHADAPPVVTLTFEQEAQRVWRVRKSFGSGGHAYLEFSRDGSEFTQDGKGREVDGALRGILRWGLRAPGTPGGKRGMAESFITSVWRKTRKLLILQGVLRISSGEDRPGVVFLRGISPGSTHFGTIFATLTP